MHKVCSRCGGKLEEDGFCMNCMNFDRKIEDGTDQSAPDSALPIEEKAVEFEQSGDEIPEVVLPQIAVKKLPDKKKFKNTAVVTLLLLIFINVCLVSLVIVNDWTTNNNMIEDENNTYAITDILGEYEQEKEDFDSNVEEVEKHKVDYDEIVLAGEPCNAYNHFSCQKDDLIPLIDDYLSSHHKKKDCITKMNNYYTMEDGEKVTFYENHSIWTFDEADRYILASDSVSDHVIFIEMLATDQKEAIALLKASLAIIDPNIPSSDLSELESTVQSTDQDVIAYCGDYYVYGGYGADGFENYYCYYIFDSEE